MPSPETGHPESRFIGMRELVFDYDNHKSGIPIIPMSVVRILMIDWQID
jgi:hypothetical protein